MSNDDVDALFTREEDLPRGLYYDREGRELDLYEWARKMEDDEYKRVALDWVGGISVSTVWLGVNYRFEEGPPLIFETMVFDSNYDELTEFDTCRYATEEEARAGHEEVVAEVRRNHEL